MVFAEHIHYPATIAADVGDDAVRPVVDERQRDGVGVDGDTPMSRGGNDLTIYVRQQPLRGAVNIAVDKDILCLFVQCQLRIGSTERHIVYSCRIQPYIRLEEWLAE